MIKLTLATEDKNKPITQAVKAVALKPFLRAGFEFAEPEKAIKEVKAWMDNNNIKYPAKATLKELSKLI